MSEVMPLVFNDCQDKTCHYKDDCCAARQYDDNLKVYQARLNEIVEWLETNWKTVDDEVAIYDAKIIRDFIAQLKQEAGK